MDLEELKSKEWKDAGELIPLIFKLEDEVPDKRKKEYDIWKDKINFLYLQYNKMAEFAAFKQIK